LDIILYNGKKRIKLTTLKPYRKGGYSYSFYLHDSLQIKLDKAYYIDLEYKDIEYYSKSFYYEDYELKGNKIELKANKTKHYKGDTINLTVKGTDINKLPIQDGRLEILIKTKQVLDYFKNELFVPDTLAYFKKKLHTEKETEISINDSLFPAVNMSYEVVVKLITPDNEIISQRKDFSYLYKSRYCAIQQKNDSIVFEYFENKESKNKLVVVKALDNFGNIDSLFQATTPFTKPINPYYASYSISLDSINLTYHVNSKPANIQCFTERTADSIRIKIDNPSNIPFHYSIFKKNKRLLEGYNKELTFYEKSNKRKGYYLFLNYIWAGKSIEESFEIPFNDKNLNIKVLEPALISPGQKTQIEVIVTDTSGKPVKDVDITAFSMNNKYEYQAPQLPYLGKPKKSTELINTFTIKTNKKENTKDLDYSYWKKLSGIDSIAYYQFIYPNKKMYRYENDTEDNITQFAPFIFKNGNPVPIHVISVDYVPIYFSWTSKQAFSFPIVSGKHHIRIRTANKTYLLDSVEFNRGKKVIFSLDEDHFTTKSLVYSSKNEISKQNKIQYSKYMLPYRVTSENQNDLVYINRFNQYHLLNTQNYWSKKVVGPFIGNVQYTNYNNFSINFKHEQGFEYDFSKELLKMRTVNLDSYFPKKLSQTGSMKSIYDLTLTSKKIAKRWKKTQDAKRRYSPRYTNPFHTKKGNGKLVLKLNKEYQPLNILLFRTTDSIITRIYHGNEKNFHDLTPNIYKFILLNKDNTHYISDAITIKANGYNYLHLSKTKMLQNDLFIKKINTYLENFYQQPISYNDNKELKNEQNSINRELKQKFRGFGNSVLLSGIVSDESGPLPGVSVLVKGTTFGTETDFDGQYSLLVYPDDILQLSYIGMETIYRTIDDSNTQNIIMKVSEDNLLEEVVVNALGLRTEYKNMSYSVSSVTSSLSGKVADVQIIGETNGLVQIRGLNSIENFNNPLIIINGMIYQGDIDEITPEMIASISVLKREKALVLYGNKAINGVIIIKTKGDKFKKGVSYSKINQTQNNTKNSIRNNFNDEAFWQPKLTTDENGKASFQVTFPDDITTWKTHYLAMNGKKQTGTTSGEINSYKELMTQLYVPRFLISGDTVNIIGKTQNITKDSVEIKTIFEINKQLISKKNRTIKNIFIDTLAVIAKKDSLHLTFKIKKENEIVDGEKRSIPVFKKGLNKTEGSFIVMDKDSSYTFRFNPKLGDVHLYAKTNLLGVLEDELEHIIVYKYDCNEQLASKLKALLAQKKITEYQGITFKYNRKIKKIIRLLNEHQKPNGYWGWWKQSAENENISLHVIDALIEAKKAGYNRAINKEHITQLLTVRYEDSKSFSVKIQLLKALQKMDVLIDYQSKIEILSKEKNLNLFEKLSLTELKQLVKVPYSIAYLDTYKQTTLFENIYYSGKSLDTNLWQNEIQTTLLAYKIIRNHNQNSSKQLAKIRQYFLEKRKQNYWLNTYESIKIVESILPDILEEKKGKSVPTLYFEESLKDTIIDFPYNHKLAINKPLKVTKTGNAPIYFTYYQKYWDANPSETKGNFEVNTYFENNSKKLVAGKATKLITEITIKKDAEFVMLSIPIPGGCSYEAKKGHTIHETHREYFKNETLVFFENLPKGSYKLEVNLLPKYTGTFTQNPAKIELMYFPTFNVNNQIKSIKIE